jgi:flagellar biosynthesis anti-sigma factor FlgM
MKIENGTLSSIAQLDTRSKKTSIPAATETAQPAKSTGAAYNVELSATAEQLQKSKDSELISHARVASIRDQLAAGTYNISGKDVANKILGVLKK